MNENINKCGKWLDSLIQLSSSVKLQLSQAKLTSNELANELRSGFQLCQLFSDSIDLYQLNKNAEYSRTLSEFNINLFLNACKLNVTDLDSNYLFEAHLLYDHVELRFEVLSLLSHLSKCKLFKAKTASFSLNLNEHDTIAHNHDETDDDKDQYYENSFDIYNIYAPSCFFVGSVNELNEIFDSFKSDESKVNDLFAQNQIKIKTTDYLIREIVLTEENYINLLSYLQSNFLEPLSKVLSHENNKTIKINLENISTFHRFIYAKLLKACSSGQGRSIRVCSVFSAYSHQFIEIYTDYFDGLNESIELITELNNDKKKSNEFKKLLEKCEANIYPKSKRSFKLSSLIVGPFQRITKYHLLLKELYFNTEKHKPEAKEAIESAWKTMEEICFHLNQVKRDQESITKIYALFKSTNHSLDICRLLKNGRFIKDETVRILNSKRVIFLFEKTLLITNTKFVYVDSFAFNDLWLSNESTKSSEHGLLLSSNQTKKQFVLYFKTESLKSYWHELINIVKSMQTLNVNNHKLTLTHFGKNIVTCSYCAKYLQGIFYQGFKCEICSMVFHKECLAKAQQLCEINNEIEVKPIVENKEIKKYEIFKVIKPNEKFGLQLNVNEFVYVIEPVISNADVCIGFKLLFNNRISRNVSDNHFFKETGLIPKSCLGKFDELNDLNFYSWFFNGDKSMACLIMEKLSSNDSTLFMVRISHSKFVITFKLRDQNIKHINIETNINTYFESVNGENYYLKSNKNEIGLLPNVISNGSCFYSIDKQRYFKSIVHLVEFFMNNSLSDYYKEIEKLGKSYRDALPNPVSVSIAINDFEKKENENNIINLKKSCYYFEVAKQPDNKFSYVFNSDGLLGYAPSDYLKKLD